MNKNRKTAIIVGVLFIIATTFFMIGQSFYDPIIKSDDVLDNAYPERFSLITGMTIGFIAIFAIILIPVFMFPILKKYNESLALGYVGFRILEGGFLAISLIGTLAFINMSQKFIESGSVLTSDISLLVNTIQALSNWAVIFSISFLFATGGLIFYYLLYKTKLIPRFLSGWGFIAEIILLVGVVLILFESFPGISPVVLEVIFALPIAVQEMVMALWLIIKGFNSKSKLY